MENIEFRPSNKKHLIQKLKQVGLEIVRFWSYCSGFAIALLPLIGNIEACIRIAFGTGMAMVLLFSSVDYMRKAKEGRVEVFQYFLTNCPSLIAYPLSMVLFG